MKSCITINLKKDNIVIKINEDFSQEDIMYSLRKKIPELKKFHRGSVRSGQKVEFEGSLVILGDVNDGAEVMAVDNIVVLGNLRGLAHAGAKGNKEAIIAASSIEAPQLRISNIIKEREREEILESTRKTYAYVDADGKMELE